MSAQPSRSTDEVPAAPVVARYAAIISGRIERSELQVVDSPTLKANRETLETDPGYAPWPPRAKRLTDEGLIAARLKALFDFGAQLPDGDEETSIRVINERWPRLKRLKGTELLQRVEVTALVRADGTAEWGFERKDPTRAPLPIPEEEVVDGRPEIDLYVQNMVRRDLRRRIR